MNLLEGQKATLDNQKNQDKLFKSIKHLNSNKIKLLRQPKRNFSRKEESSPNANKLFFPELKTINST